MYLIADGEEETSAKRDFERLFKYFSLQVSTLLGANLRCEEIEELMDQADLVGMEKNNFASISRSVPSFPLFTLTFFSLVQA